MNSTYIPQHIFISYSRKDKSIVDQIILDLRAKEIPVWVDNSNLELGTPDWEQKIRDAIEDALVVLLIASPESRKSPYVRGELDLAASLGKSIYPLWVNGNQWVEAVSLGMVNYQYADCRTPNYGKGINQVVEKIQKEYHNLPNHGLVRERWTAMGEHSWSISRPSVKDFLIIDAFDPEEDVINADKVRVRDLVAIRPSAYTISQELLNDLYMHHLKNQYEAFRYGQDWILVCDDFYDRFVLAPLSWLTPDGMCYAHEIPLGWANKSPDFWRLKPRTHWQVRNPNQLEPYYGLAFNNKEYMDYHNDGALKGIIGLVRDGYLVAKSIQEINVNDYKYSGIFSGFLSDWYKGKIVVETSKPIDRKRLSRRW